MVHHHTTLLVTTVVILINLQGYIEAKKYKPAICPIGFSVAYLDDNEPICYRLKGSEQFDDLYDKCAGNLYTYKLYTALNITRTEMPLWTEYRSQYPDGPFIDWSHTENAGDVLESSFKVLDKGNSSMNMSDMTLCVVADPTGDYVARSCDSEYHRYCFIKPYSEPDSCDSLNGSVRFSSPIPACILAVSGHSGGAVRATWNQSHALCMKRGGVLLNRGWRYSNSPFLRVSDPQERRFPLGYLYEPVSRTLHTYGGSRRSVPQSDWNFAHSLPNVTGYVAVINDLWTLVNDTDIFFNVICEKPLELLAVNLNITVNKENQLILQTDIPISIDNVSCFTDSEGYAPEPVDITKYSSTNFLLKPHQDGYYWCIINDSIRYLPSSSNRTLYIRVDGSKKTQYAIKIKLKDKTYDFENVKRIFKEYCLKKLKEYVFYYTMYVNVYSEVSPSFVQLSEFRNSYSELDKKEKNVLYDVLLKRIYLDQRTLLIHVELNSNMKVVPPAEWGGIEILYMKPTYYCSYNGYPATTLPHYFHDIYTDGCEVHKCVGDYNEGKQVVTTRLEFCTDTTPPSIRLFNEVPGAMPIANVYQSTPTRENLRESHNSSEESMEPMPKPTTPRPANTTTEALEPTSDPSEVITVTTAPTEVMTVTSPPTEVNTVTTGPTEVVTTELITPTTTQVPPSPEDQLQQVMDDLQSLLNTSDPVAVENIDRTFDQVDELLESSMDLDIPGNLLHLLDKIGGRIDLAGAEEVTAIRNNIALLVADADPMLPVRGLRISARENDVFTNNAFEIIRDEVNSTHLNANDSEAVVKLPDSVGNSSRRISFVIFRNDRAFQSPMYAVNSRVLSVNVENLTQFEDNEVVDIHFSPFSGYPNRNESRACAFWHFQEDGRGYWSQEGCTFIEATEPGMLDTCRCNHLTHFAEVLVPRTVFSERNEYVLELLTVMGCCLSIFGVAIVALTAILFRSWRKDFVNKIWLQLCIAIFCVMLLFLIVVFAQFKEYDVPCMLLGVGLHYFVLASFCWMLVAAVLSYRRLVLVFTRGTSHKLLKAAAFSWGAPCAVVGILLSVSPLSYTGRFEEKTPTGAFCYPSGLALWLAVYAPILIMLLANWTLFILIVRSVFASRRVQRHGDSNEALRCASVSCLLVFLFGLPWLFGLFAYNVVAAYFFTITATFQGFVLFLFFVVGNKKTRDLWLNKLKIKQTRKVPVTSSTFTNRSTGAPASRAAAPSIEAKVTKPKSLQVSDDSRFS